MNDFRCHDFLNYLSSWNGMTTLNENLPAQDAGARARPTATATELRDARSCFNNPPDGGVLVAGRVREIVANVFAARFDCSLGALNNADEIESVTSECPMPNRFTNYISITGANIRPLSQLIHHYANTPAEGDAAAPTSTAASAEADPAPPEEAPITDTQAYTGILGAPRIRTVNDFIMRSFINYNADHTIACLQMGISNPGGTEFDLPELMPEAGLYLQPIVRDPTGQNGTTSPGMLKLLEIYGITNQQIRDYLPLGTDPNSEAIFQNLLTELRNPNSSLNAAQRKLLRTLQLVNAFIRQERRNNPNIPIDNLLHITPADWAAIDQFQNLPANRVEGLPITPQDLNAVIRWAMYLDEGRYPQVDSAYDRSVRVTMISPNEPPTDWRRIIGESPWASALLFITAGTGLYTIIRMTLLRNWNPSIPSWGSHSTRNSVGTHVSRDLETRVINQFRDISRHFAEEIQKRSEGRIISRESAIAFTEEWVRLGNGLKILRNEVAALNFAEPQEGREIIDLMNEVDREVSRLTNNAQQRTPQNQQALANKMVEVSGRLRSAGVRPPQNRDSDPPDDPSAGGATGGGLSPAGSGTQARRSGDTIVGHRRDNTGNPGRRPIHLPPLHGSTRMRGMYGDHPPRPHSSYFDFLPHGMYVFFEAAGESFAESFAGAWRFAL